MENIRQRLPFKFSDSEDNTTPSEILDEQEQDEVIQDLRRRNSSSNQHYGLAGLIILFLSFLLHVVFLFSSRKASPLLSILPSEIIDPDPPLPLVSLFSLISLALHLNLAILLDPQRARSLLGGEFGEQISLHYLSYQFSYAIAAVAPTLCLFLGRSWQTIVWWCFPIGLIYITQSLQQAIAQGHESIMALEAMRYRAPGA
ncbi:hypothetical protein HGRIS_006076 [Hohenbuehelia grisea]|uniref:Uncharacterized protein n=1 Tax=Hohenbuehelia grisea TaxID=104357 RepID=A0ABR3JZW3_9AGAR